MEKLPFLGKHQIFDAERRIRDSDRRQVSAVFPVILCFYYSIVLRDTLERRKREEILQKWPFYDIIIVG